MPPSAKSPKGSRRFAVDTDRILTISTVPCFAAYWLLPRLANFNEHPPDIQANIRAALSPTDFTRDSVDMAVRFGGGTWPGLISIKLYDEELVPVCSPNSSVVSCRACPVTS